MSFVGENCSTMEFVGYDNPISNHLMVKYVYDPYKYLEFHF